MSCHQPVMRGQPLSAGCNRNCFQEASSFSRQGFFKLSRFTLLFILAVIVTKTSHADRKELLYDVFQGSDKIGMLKAVRVNDGLQSNYHIETRISYRILLPIEVLIVVGNSFNNEKMTKAYAKREVNGSVKTNNTIFWNQSLYYMITKDKDTTTWNRPISNCVSALYFKEPMNIEQVFSENYLRNLRIVETDPGTYQVTLPDGHNNYYKYSNGICTEVELEIMWNSIHLKLTTSSG